jgi:endonuclease/exonuclease/phosphatase family metal-dependent hydrolase
MNVRVGSYNVKNLFAKADIVPGSKTRPKPESEMKALGQVIRKMDCDVLMLQECSSEKTLNAFVAQQGLSELYPHVSLIPGNSERGINVAVMSKFPIETFSNKDHKIALGDGYGDSEFSRDLLRADIDVDGKPGADLTVYTTHSKSRRPAAEGDTPSDVQRLGEAKAIREIVTADMEKIPSRMWLVTGDMNDNTDDASVQAMLNPTDGGEKWEDSLAHLPSDQRNTWPANPNLSHGFDPEQFDHILYAESKAGQITEKTIHRFPRQPEGSEFTWLNSAASDHIPVSVNVEIIP